MHWGQLWVFSQRFFDWIDLQIFWLVENLLWHVSLGSSGGCVSNKYYEKQVTYLTDVLYCSGNIPIYCCWIFKYTSLYACKEMYKPGIAIHCQCLSRLVDLSIVHTWTAGLIDAASCSIWQQPIWAYAAWCTACVDLYPTRVKNERRE